LIVVGNKTDIEEREVSHDEAKEEAEKLGFKYAEVSCKTGEGINELFIEIAKENAIRQTRL